MWKHCSVLWAWRPDDGFLWPAPDQDEAVACCSVIMHTGPGPQPGWHDYSKNVTWRLMGWWAELEPNRREVWSFTITERTPTMDFSWVGAWHRNFWRCRAGTRQRNWPTTKRDCVPLVLNHFKNYQTCWKVLKTFSMVPCLNNILASQHKSNNSFYFILHGHPALFWGSWTAAGNNITCIPSEG